MDHDRARQLLADARARTEHELERLRFVSREERTGEDEAPGDLGTDLFEQERDQGLTEDLEERLRAIERAEQRLADGSYGRSVVSGAPIPDARLEAVPWTETTVEEAQRG